MNKINVSGFSESDLKKLVTNANNVFNYDLDGNLGLNQVRTEVARLFGAKSWQSLCAAVKANEASKKTGEDHAFVGYRHVIGNGWDPETTFTTTYFGLTEEMACANMAYDFCMDWFGETMADHEFENDSMIEQELKSLGITGDRQKELATQIRATDPDERHDLFHLFTFKEIVQAYSKFFDDEEDISVEEVEVNKAGASTGQIPQHVHVIHYDIKDGMAISVENGNLIGYFGIGKTPAPYEYEWDNGFDFDFITPDQAEALKRAGHSDIVSRFERSGSVCEG